MVYYSVFVCVESWFYSDFHHLVGSPAREDSIFTQFCLIVIVSTNALNISLNCFCFSFCRDENFNKLRIWEKSLFVKATIIENFIRNEGKMEWTIQHPYNNWHFNLTTYATWWVAGDGDSHPLCACGAIKSLAKQCRKMIWSICIWFYW